MTSLSGRIENVLDSVFSTCDDMIEQGSWSNKLAGRILLVISTALLLIITALVVVGIPVLLILGIVYWAIPTIVLLFVVFSFALFNGFRWSRHNITQRRK